MLFCASAQQSRNRSNFWRCFPNCRTRDCIDSTFVIQWKKGIFAGSRQRTKQGCRLCLYLKFGGWTPTILMPASQIENKFSIRSLLFLPMKDWAKLPSATEQSSADKKLWFGLSLVSAQNEKVMTEVITRTSISSQGSWDVRSPSSCECIEKGFCPYRF